MRRLLWLMAVGLAAVPAPGLARPLMPVLGAEQAQQPQLGEQGRTLRQGDHGLDVQHLRADLVWLGYLPQEAERSGAFDQATWFAVVALQKYHRLPRDGVVGSRTRRALRRLQRPRPRLPGSGRRAEVWLDRQLVLVMRGRQVLRTLPVSSGAGGRTPAGRFAVYRKEPRSWSVPFAVWLPWASYFVGGIAFHGYPEVPVYPASHGCVRVPMPFARELYELLSLGTRVDVVAKN